MALKMACTSAHADKIPERINLGKNDLKSPCNAGAFRLFRLSV
jgi:hypothetical protein